MNIFHNSRCTTYRLPYGAVEKNTTVTLSIDIATSKECSAHIRTWSLEGQESYIAMERVKKNVKVPSSHPLFGLDEPISRFQAELNSDKEGIIWYYFLIDGLKENTLYYGASPHTTGGEGKIYFDCPPSFQLSVFSSHNEPPYWNNIIHDYLLIDEKHRSCEEDIKTLHENFPFSLYSNDIPWEEKDKNFNRIKKKNYKEVFSPFKKKQDCFILNNGLFGFWRRDEIGNPLCIVINTSNTDIKRIAIPRIEKNAIDLFSGYKKISSPQVDESFTESVPFPKTFQDIPSATHYIIEDIYPNATSITYFYPKKRLQKTVAPGIGVLAHVTSLPSHTKKTTQNQLFTLPEHPDKRKKKTSLSLKKSELYTNARKFLDWLSSQGVRYWQILPLNPCDSHNSPYAGMSAFAGNLDLIDTDYLTPGFIAAYALENKAAYKTFIKTEESWLAPYAYFTAIQSHLKTGNEWQTWPKRYRTFDLGLFESEKDLKALAAMEMKKQFIFQEIWNDILSYAHSLDIKVIGDIPLYVNTKSVDVWAHPSFFQLDENGYPQNVAGCPPDAFAPEGQKWGNPLYDWDNLKKSDYAWWMQRIERCLELYDYIRIDHFIGFVRYFSIGSEAPASEGSYRKGPGYDFFKRAYERFGDLPFIAEDLGSITPKVRMLIAQCGFLGMDIIQFADGGDPLNTYNPRPDKILYSGTHDNQTLVGYCKDRYPHLDPLKAAQTLIETIQSSDASVKIYPLQDLLGLDDSARMNIPGTIENCWEWQCDAINQDHLFFFEKDSEEE